MSPRARIVISAACLVLVGALLAWWLSSNRAEPAAAPPPPESNTRSPDWERWAMLDGPGGRPERRAPEGEPAAPEPPSDEEWEERRRRWRARWRAAVDIVPLGPSDPGLDPDGIREALAPGRDALRSCVREAGGWRAMRRARREGGAAGGGRRRRSVSFDVRADGTVDAESVAFAPPMPEPFDACFRTYFASPRLDGVGPDGARVELPMGRGRRGRRGGSGDGGVDPASSRGRRWRDRVRGGDRGSARQDRAPERGGADRADRR